MSATVNQLLLTYHNVIILAGLVLVLFSRLVVWQANLRTFVFTQLISSVSWQLKYGLSVAWSTRIANMHAPIDQLTGDKKMLQENSRWMGKEFFSTVNVSSSQALCWGSSCLVAREKFIFCLQNSCYVPVLLFFSFRFPVTSYLPWPLLKWTTN